MDTRVIRVQYSSISGAVLEYFGLSTGVFRVQYWSISGAVLEYFGLSTAQLRSVLIVKPIIHLFFLPVGPSPAGD